jgi:DNA uptake protein ComE-like DNA-binding protein
MNTRVFQAVTHPASPARERGSVLVIVLWIAFGLVSIALYFAHSMSLELRAADNSVAGVEADQAIEGAARYVSNLLAGVEEPGWVPDRQTYLAEAVPVGDATFWLIGRSDAQTTPDRPFFGLVDEASKLNLNTASSNQLEWLPGMTPDLLVSILTWRDPSTNSAAGGAGDETYMRLNPAYRCKHGAFESVDELRLVYGADLELLLGEDANLNGALDPNENDGDVSLPTDNRNGRLDPGLREYVTVYSLEPNTTSNGVARLNVTSSNGLSQVYAMLGEKLGATRANEIRQKVQSSFGPVGPGAALATNRSVLEFYIRSEMTADEFAQVETNLTASSGTSIPGLVNVNSASEAVLACLPGIGVSNAPSLVAYRQSNRTLRNSLAWVKEVLDQPSAFLAGPHLTGRSYQFTADVVALGHHDRGYRRVQFVFDTSEGTPRIVFRQDLTHLGWALGRDTRRTLELAKDKR